jgi:hypothetical protein
MATIQFLVRLLPTIVWKPPAECRISDSSKGPAQVFDPVPGLRNHVESLVGNLPKPQDKCFAQVVGQLPHRPLGRLPKLAIQRASLGRSIAGHGKLRIGRLARTLLTQLLVPFVGAKLEKLGTLLTSAKRHVLCNGVL